eukprot:s206_g52.t1
MPLWLQLATALAEIISPFVSAQEEMLPVFLWQCALPEKWFGRLAVRASHALLAHGRALWQYVHDLLTWLDRFSASLWASLLVAGGLIRCPWHSNELAQGGIGRGIVSDAAIQTGPDQTVQIKELQSIVGRLLWVTSAWRYVCPLLIPLYKAMARICLAIVGMDHATFLEFLDALDDTLALKQDVSTKHHSLLPRVSVLGVANANVLSLDQTRQLHIKSRRVWTGIRDSS